MKHGGEGSVVNTTTTPCISHTHLMITKEGGTGEALKLKLHLNSEVYKAEILMILVRKRGKFFELHLKKTRSVLPVYYDITLTMCRDIVYYHEMV